MSHGWRRKRHRSVGPLYGGDEVHSEPGTYALDWAVEREGDRAAAEWLIEQARSKSVDAEGPTTSPTVLAIWEHLTGHRLSSDRSEQFRSRLEVTALAGMQPIRVWAGAVLARHAHPAGHLLLADWCARSMSASRHDLTMARPSFVDMWAEVASSQSRTVEG